MFYILNSFDLTFIICIPFLFVFAKNISRYANACNLQLLHQLVLDVTVPKKICGHVVPAQVLVKKMREIVTMISIAMVILNVAKTIVLDLIFMRLLTVATNHLQVRKFESNVFFDYFHISLLILCPSLLYN